MTKFLKFDQIFEFFTKFLNFSGQLLLECPNQCGTSSKSPRLESFVRNDIILWKSARTQIHHFLISSLLIGNDTNRKAFASIYRYTMLQKLSKCEVEAWLCWNLMILPPPRFYIKLNFGDSNCPEMSFLAILKTLNFEF